MDSVFILAVASFATIGVTAVWYYIVSIRDIKRN